MTTPRTTPNPDFRLAGNAQAPETWFGLVWLEWSRSAKQKVLKNALNNA
jgi:hypothetical protein